jgi:hypothetical protein
MHATRTGLAFLNARLLARSLAPFLKPGRKRGGLGKRWSTWAGCRMSGVRQSAFATL